MAAGQGRPWGSVSATLRDDARPAFDLAYVRTGRPSDCPAVVLPGGPGLASVLPYAAFFRRSPHPDLLFVEHRGVGLSRHDLSWTDLPPSALTVRQVVDDVVSVLDAEGVERAVFYGSSYGSYLAQAAGAWHPQRVAAMVLDFVVAGAGDHAVVRRHARSLLWEGDEPALADVAALVRAVVHRGTPLAETSAVARICFEHAGPEVLRRLLRARVEGRLPRTWRRLAGLTRAEVGTTAPCLVAAVEVKSTLQRDRWPRLARGRQEQLTPDWCNKADNDGMRTWNLGDADVLSLVVQVQLRRMQWRCAVAGDNAVPRPVTTTNQLMNVGWLMGKHRARRRCSPIFGLQRTSRSIAASAREAFL